LGKLSLLLLLLDFVCRTVFDLAGNVCCLGSGAALWYTLCFLVVLAAVLEERAGLVISTSTSLDVSLDGPEARFPRRERVVGAIGQLAVLARATLSGARCSLSSTCRDRYSDDSHNS